MPSAITLNSAAVTDATPAGSQRTCSGSASAAAIASGTSPRNTNRDARADLEQPGLAALQPVGARHAEHEATARDRLAEERR
jgi:hypothetical protein